MNEVWKSVPEYEGLYWVSNKGRVKSKRKILKAPFIESIGYKLVCLSKNGKTKTFTVHKLVAVVFMSYIPTDRSIVIDHIDNNPQNNSVENLQIITQRKNASKDRHRHNYTSKHIGVSFCKQTSKWRAVITTKGKKTCLGRYYKEEDAAKAYKEFLAEM
jgi:hypothetical protein